MCLTLRGRATKAQLTNVPYELEMVRSVKTDVGDAIKKRNIHMKKFALAALAVALSAGAAYAENPYVGEPANMAAQDKAFMEPGQAPVALGNIDYTAPASIRQSAPVYQNGSAHRFGDASPASYQN
jgi:hypothetical protein